MVSYLWFRDFGDAAAMAEPYLVNPKPLFIILLLLFVVS
jgi:hypothetical protein